MHGKHKCEVIILGGNGTKQLVLTTLFKYLLLVIVCINSKCKPLLFHAFSLAGLPL